MKLCYTSRCAVVFMLFFVVGIQYVFGEEGYCNGPERLEDDCGESDLYGGDLERLLEDTRPGVEKKLHGNTVDYTKLSSFVLIKMNAFYYFDTREIIPDIDPKFRTLFHDYKRAIYDYEQGKIPKKGVDLSKLADILSVKITAPEKLEDRKTFDEYKFSYENSSCESGTLCHPDNANSWRDIAIYLGSLNIWTQLDEPMVGRISRLIERVQKVMPGKVLELGAGRGMLAQALIDRGIDLEALDNFSDPYFEHCRLNDSCSNGLVKNRDAFENIADHDDFPIIMSLSGPNDYRIHTEYAHEDKERVFLFLYTSEGHWYQNDNDYEHRRNVSLVVKKNGDVHMAARVSLKLGVKGIFNNIGSVIVLTSRKLVSRMVGETKEESISRANAEIHNEQQKYKEYYLDIAGKVDRIVKETQSHYLENDIVQENHPSY